MKRWIGFILALTFVFIIPLQTYASKQPEAFLLSGTHIMQDKRIAGPEQIKELLSILDKSKPVSFGEGSVQQVATLTPEISGRSQGSYSIVLGADHTLYMQQDKRVLKLPQKEFLAWITQFASDLYTYRPLPKATVEYGGKKLELPVSQSGYAYRRIDGKYVRPQPPKKPALDTLPLVNGLYIPTITPQPQNMQLQVVKDGKKYFSGTPEEASAFLPKEPGTYTVLVQAGFSDAYYKGSVTYRYTLSSDANITFTAKGLTTHAGEAVVLRAKNLPSGQPITVKSDLNYTPTFFQEDNGDYVAFLPVSVFTKPGSYNVTVQSGESSETFVIQSQDKAFPVQHLTVAPATSEQTILSKEANAEFARTIDPLKDISDSTRHWEGRFIMPVSDQKVTTPFGSIRYTNGSKHGSVHGAIDLAVPQGTPVAASGNGRVLYAGFLKLTGNTVVIEHGYGLKTWYFHMHSLDVQSGDRVQKGQPIGTVGSTGFSTGPHLHFRMSFHDLSINPYTAIETDLLVLDHNMEEN